MSMQLWIRFADLGHDDVVDHAYKTGFLSGDLKRDREFFDAIHEILLTRIHQANEELRSELVREFGRMLDLEREGRHERLVRQFFQPQ
jgi:hypothetical protein